MFIRFITLLWQTIRTFLSKLSNENLSAADNIAVAQLLHRLMSFERIAKHAQGLVKLAEEGKDERLEYSDIDAGMLNKLFEITLGCYDDAITALETGDKEIAERAINAIEQIEAKRQEYKTKHMERVSANARSGVIFSEALRCMARIAANLRSIVEQ